LDGLTLKAEDTAYLQNISNHSPDTASHARKQISSHTAVTPSKLTKFMGHLFKMGLVDSPKCDRCKQAPETASHFVGDCEALAALRFRYLGYRFIKPGDFKDIVVSRLLHFV
jgi:hypothetical protein